MIQKQSNNHHSGRAHNHQDKKRRGTSGVQQKACSFFLTWRGLFTINLFLTLWSNLTLTVTFWDAWEKVWQKRPELWHNHNWLLHHNNAPAHTSLTTTKFVTNNNMVIVPHPPYSPNLAPCEFALFPKLKMKLRWLLKQCLTSKGNRKRYLTALRKITSTELSKHGKNDEIAA
jgi:hypothetical protein